MDEATLEKVLRPLVGKRKPFTYTEVARVCGVNPVAVSYWVSGSTVPEPEHLVALARVLNLPLTTLAKARLLSLRRRLIERHQRVLAELYAEIEQLEAQSEGP